MKLRFAPILSCHPNGVNSVEKIHQCPYLPLVPPGKDDPVLHTFPTVTKSVPGYRTKH